MASAHDEEDSHRHYAMQLATASTVPMVLKAAVELGVFEIIQRAGPGALLSPSQIASQFPSQNNPHAPFMLDRMLCLLSSHSIVTCSLASTNQDGQVERLYGLAPVSKYFIPNQDGGSLSPFTILFQDRVSMHMWYDLKNAVVEGGIPFDKAHGMSAVSFLEKDARFREVFGGSMAAFNVLFMERILQTYHGFQGLKSLVDVGGGNGSILSMIISKYPEIKGINYDLAPVIEKSPTYPGIENVAGDMFESVPKGDAIFMKWVMHLWHDEQCIQLLKNCYEATPGNGKVIVVNTVLPETPETSAAGKSLLQCYLYIASFNPQGLERTEREFESLGKRAGFARVHVASSAFNFSVVEFIKESA